MRLACTIAVRRVRPAAEIVPVIFWLAHTAYRHYSMYRKHYCAGKQCAHLRCQFLPRKQGPYTHYFVDIVVSFELHGQVHLLLCLFAMYVSIS